MILGLFVSVFLISVVIIPPSGAQIVPRQELEFSETVSLRWNTEVSCTGAGASFFRSTLDHDSDGTVSESELERYTSELQAGSEGDWVQINGMNGKITSAYAIDCTGAIGDVHDGGDFTYSYDLELAWPELSTNEVAYNVRLYNPDYVSKAEIDMNIPEDFRIVDYRNFDNAESPNGKSDFYGELAGGGTSGDITLVKSEGSDNTEIDFMPIFTILTIFSVVVIVILIIITLKKD